MPIWGWFIIAGVVLLVGFFALAVRLLRKVSQGEALVITGGGAQPKVAFTRALVIPLLHRAEVMDISLKTIEVHREGREGLICKDNIRADIRVTFFVRVNPERDSVIEVAQAIGCARASEEGTLKELFVAKFSEALKTVGRGLDFVELYEKRDEFRAEMVNAVGAELNGYVLDNAAIDYLEQTPLEVLDKDNILDGQGIKKITELTASQAILTNEHKQRQRKEIRRQDVEAEEQILELNRRQAEAEAKQQREIAEVQARELASIKKEQAKARMEAESARIKTDEALAIEEENKRRQVEVAEKNRERVIGVETERVEKDRSLEAISREREVEVQRILKEKELEQQRKEIAEVIRERVIVEKTVAEEEEATKTLRATETAKREKAVKVIGAEADAQELLVKDIKAAEASEQVAKHRAKEEITLAEAKLEASDKHAAAKIRMAEGVIAEAAADGLAAVRVKEANSLAIEKEGQAEARVTLLKMEALADGEQKKGLAKVKVDEANAEAVRKLGLAEAEVVREKSLAKAAGDQELGMAQVRVAEADAVAIEKRGVAEAVASKQKLFAEAAGIAQKADAMKKLDGVGREHEEFRLQLDKAKAIELAAIEAKRQIAEAQAGVLGNAFRTAKFNIVGGDGKFFDQFVKAVTLGQSVDGAVDQSETIRKVFGEYLEGHKSLPADLVEVLSRPAVGADELKNLSVAAFLGKLATGSDGSTRAKLEALALKAKELGLDDLVKL